MGWHDDGVAMGLWGKSGIPRGLNSSSWNSDSYRSSKAGKPAKKWTEKSASSGARFSKSEEMAQAMGFELAYDDRAFNGRYFHKGGKLWIHNIKALKSSLSITSDKELEDMGYDVDTYYALAG